MCDLSCPLYDGLEPAASPNSSGLHLFYHKKHDRHKICASSAHHPIRFARSADLYSGYVLRIRIPNGVVDVDKRHAILQDVMNTVTTITCAGQFELCATVRYASELLQSCGFNSAGDPRSESSRAATQILYDALSPVLSQCVEEDGYREYLIMRSFAVRKCETNPEDYLLDVPLLMNFAHCGRVVMPLLSGYEEPYVSFRWPESILQALYREEVFLSFGPRYVCLCDSRLRKLLRDLPVRGCSLHPLLTRQVMLAGSENEVVTCRWGWLKQTQVLSLTLTGTHHCPPSVSSVTVFCSGLCVMPRAVDFVLMRQDALSTSYNIEDPPPGIDSVLVTCDASTEEPVIIDLHGVFACHLARLSSNDVRRNFDRSIVLPLTFKTRWNTETPDGSHAHP